MKKLMFITLLFTVKSYAQKEILPMVDGKVDYVEVVQLDSSYKKNDLFINAKKFFVDVFNSGKDVIQMEDKEAGLVIGKGYAVVDYKANFMYTFRTKIWHTVKISLKDGKYKYEITEMSYSYHVPADQYSRGADAEGSLENFPKHNQEKTFKEIDSEIKDEIIKLKKYMAKKQSSTDF